MPIKTNKYPVFNSDKELADFMLSNLADSLKQSIKLTVTIMVKQEMEALRKEVDQNLQFNGYYDRNMTSTVGKIEGIQIPRFRQSLPGEANLKSFSVFGQQKEQFYELVAEMHRQGVSTRKVDKICRAIFGIKCGKNQTSAVHRDLAEQEALQINSQAIQESFEYILWDGIWVKAKQFGLKASNKIPLLCALGIKSDGSRKVIGFLPAQDEGYESWHRLILDLKQRGLTAEGLKLNITDDGGGLKSALEQLFPKVPVQGCIVHKMRNVIAKTKHKNKSAVAEGLKAIYNSETKEQAVQNFEKFCKQWYVAEPKAVESLRFNFERTLTFYDFPKELWHTIRTTNILERELSEVGNKKYA